MNGCLSLDKRTRDEETLNRKLVRTDGQLLTDDLLGVTTSAWVEDSNEVRSLCQDDPCAPLKNSNNGCRSGINGNTVNIRLAPESGNESGISVRPQIDAINWESIVKVSLQPQPDNRKSMINICFNNTEDIDHTQEDTSVSQDNNDTYVWRNNRSLCNVQQFYKRKSHLEFHSNINIPKKYRTHTASRCVKHTCARKRRREAKTNDTSTFLTQARDTGPSSQVRLAIRRSSKIQRLMPKAICQLVRSELLPSCFLNVNTNAGISDTSDKTETKQASCTSVHSSDQYFSTHTDTPDGKVMDSDNEVSPSFSFTEDAAEKVVSPHGESGPALSKSCDQVIKLRHLDNKDKNTDASEISRHRGQKKYGEEPSNDENADIKADKPSRTNAGALSLAPDDHQTNKHKKKTKTTETVYIKFESSMSKKVTTTTTLLKDGRRPGTNKSKSDTPKQLLPPDDTQKAISSVPEKLDNRITMETPRHTKIVRCSEGHQESPEVSVRCNDETTWADESGPRKAAQNVRTANSDDNLHHFKTPPLSTHTPASIGKLCERITSQKSPTKSHSPHSSMEPKWDLLDSDYASERESSAATIVNVPKVSPRNKTASTKEGKEQTIRNESVNKVEKPKSYVSPLRELRNAQEKKEQSKHISPKRESGCSRLEADRTDQSHTAASHLYKNESPKQDSSSVAETSSRKKSIARHKGDSPQKRSPIDIVAKHDSKKVVAAKGRSRTTDDLPTKEDASEHSKGKAIQHQTGRCRKRSPVGTKTQSRSPESKRRKRSAKKSVDSKGSKSPESSKLDKVKKLKSADKVVDKKKKKKKQKQKGTGKSDADSSDKVSAKRTTASARSRSIESGKTTQTLTSSTSAPQFVEVASVPQPMSPGSYWTGDDNKESLQGDKYSGALEVRSLDRENSAKSREVKVKNRAASSAENVSMTEGAAKPIRAAESVPTFTGTVYTSITKVVQVASCPKVKKSEKDLQQAELGWNSSILSAQEKAAAEKIKQNQKKVKARYYLMKSKTRSTECEQAAARFKRQVPRRNQADGDNGAREVNDKGDTPQSEKTKPGQGKSVQFSESTEDHEASRDEIVDEYPAFQDSLENDGTLPQTINKYTIVLQPSGKSIILPQLVSKSTAAYLPTSKHNAETKSLNKADTDVSLLSNKSTLQKKEEPRSQTTPPRKRRPIWQKKQQKEKALANTRAPAAPVKSVPVLVPIKQRQSSDNILKPAARLNLAAFYPGKPKIQSPSFSNISLDDKRAVAYNTWINSNILAAPMNKATRKMVAKTGSPVDIKEIIEGSSVDAADYYRSMRALHELGVRAAKSVPSLGPRRTTSTDVVGGKKLKLPTEYQKKNKVHESSSVRSLSSVDGADDQGFSAKNRYAVMDASVSPASSTDVDNGPGLKYKVGTSRSTEQSYPRKKKEKHCKKSSKDGSGKWHVVNAQDVHSVPDLTRVQYYGDMTDFNTLNMGLSWVVQSVFSRLPFLNQRPASSSANASGDMAAGHVGE